MDDQFHDRAVHLESDITGEKTISDLILSESVTGVGARLGPRAGKEVFENVLYDPSISVVFVNRSLAERSLSTYLKYGRRVSFADAVSLRIMFDRHIRRIASFDADFDVIEGITRLR